jgi:hypothetical protein
MPKLSPDQVVEGISQEAQGLLCVAVIQLDSGMSLAHKQLPGGFDPEVAGAYNSEVVRQKVKAINALNLKNQQIEDILITLTDQFHLLRLSKDAKSFVYVASESAKSNLGMLRAIVKKFSEQMA